MKRKLSSVGDFLTLKGEYLGVSKWIDITQELINKFADATFDHQWIHVDEAKAKELSPLKTTVAHGYFVLSLIPYLFEDIVDIQNTTQKINYSVEKFVFKAPIPVNSRFRLKATLKSAIDLGGSCMATIKCSFEMEGSNNPVVEGNVIYIYHFG